MNLKILAAATAAIALAAGAANAGAVVFSDNFDGSTAQGNWPGDATFLSIPQPGNVNGLPSVDLVGGSFFGSLAFSGNSVDLDGSTTNPASNPAGEIQSVSSLTGDFTVQFELAGNNRGATPETTEVAIGGTHFDLTPGSSDGYTLHTLFFKGVSGQLSFTDLGVSDQQGNLLDNVVVTSGVPEPATWAVMLVGFGGLGAAMRGRRKQAAATA